MQQSDRFAVRLTLALNLLKGSLRRVDTALRNHLLQQVVEEGRLQFLHLWILASSVKELALRPLLQAMLLRLVDGVSSCKLLHQIVRLRAMVCWLTI